MAICETCGNYYERSFQVILGGVTHSFDSFECAIQKLAPHCRHCQTRVIGHGLEYKSDIYCCAGCARMNGITDLKDHA